MSAVEKVAALINGLGCNPRIKLNHNALPEAWGNRGICIPVSGYIEVHGPWPFKDVEWLEIDHIVVEHIGRLVKPKRHDYLNDVISLLQSEEIPYSIIEGMVRISFKNFE